MKVLRCRSPISPAWATARRMAMLAAILVVTREPATVRADESAAVVAARELAIEGLQHLDAGRYAAAEISLARAYELVKLPTIAVNRARALVHLGRWVEAASLYDEASRLDPGVGRVDAQRDAQGQAEKEKAALAPRIPRLRVVIAGGSQPASIKLDGVAWAAGSGEHERLVDPGRHTIEAVRTGQTWTETILLEEGATRTVHVRLAQPVHSELAGAPAKTPLAKDPRTAPPPYLREDDSGASRRLGGWIALGAGGAALIFGGITTAMALSKESELSQVCEGTRCPEERAEDVRHYNLLTTEATVGFVLAGIGAASGVLLLLSAPNKPQRTVAWIGPQGVRLQLAF